MRRLVALIDTRLSGDLAATGRGGEANALMAKAFAAIQSLAQSDPSDVQAQGDLAYALRSWSEAELAVGDLSTSEGHLQQAVDILERLRPKQALFEFQTELGLCLSRLARIADRTGRLDAALDDRLKALPFLEAFGLESEAQNELVSVYEELGDNFAERAKRSSAAAGARRADWASAAQYFARSAQASSDLTARGNVAPLTAAQTARVVAKRDQARRALGSTTPHDPLSR
jgi:tetratricopeptide (TPR) repeat protein